MPSTSIPSFTEPRLPVAMRGLSTAMTLADACSLPLGTFPAPSEARLPPGLFQNVLEVSSAWADLRRRHLTVLETGLRGFQRAFGPIADVMGTPEDSTSISLHELQAGGFQRLKRQAEVRLADVREASTAVAEFHGEVDLLRQQIQDILEDLGGEEATLRTHLASASRTLDHLHGRMDQRFLGDWNKDLQGALDEAIAQLRNLQEEVPQATSDHEILARIRWHLYRLAGLAVQIRMACETLQEAWEALVEAFAEAAENPPTAQESLRLLTKARPFWNRLLNP